MEMPAAGHSRAMVLGSLTIPGRPEQVSLARAFIGRALATNQVDADIDAATLLTSEIVTNAVRHGGGRGHLELWLASGKLFFRVSDDGPGITAETPALPPAAHQLGGRGIWIARQIVDEMTIATGADGTVVTATLTL